AGVPDPRAVQFDHLSFNLPDEDALLDLRARLKAAECEVTDVVDHGFIRSVYFTDPNGIALEASYWVLDATGRAPDFGDERLFADPDPVPAVAELRRDGAVRSVPHTNLV
ncbi:MAG TPA: VOC family protein, partial [Acidimicrobiales bacterium]|nr:VOC family protein [Acidimicrobiales bacterium]